MAGLPAFVAVQLESDPPVLVRNTFLHVSARPPTPPFLHRASTAPPPETQGLGGRDEESSGPEGDDTSEDSENAEHANNVALELPAYVPVCQSVTQEQYESPTLWAWAGDNGVFAPASVYPGVHAPPCSECAWQACIDTTVPNWQPDLVMPAPGGPHWSRTTLLPGAPPPAAPRARLQLAGPVGFAAPGRPTRRGARPQWEGAPPAAAGAAGIAGAPPLGGNLAGEAAPAARRPACRAEAPAGSAPSSAGPGQQPAPVAPVTALRSLGGAPQPQTLTRAFSTGSGYFRVHWTVDARKLHGNEKHAVSPEFELPFGELLPCVPFKMMLFPRQPAGGKAGTTFKRTQGRGIVQLKCEADLSGAPAEVRFRVSIGRGNTVQDPRGPVSHAFSLGSVCGLPRELEEWDFQAVVDRKSMTFVVCLEVVPQISELA